MDFKRQVMPLSDEFVKIANLKFTRENAEQVYEQAEEEWQRQLQQIAEKDQIINKWGPMIGEYPAKKDELEKSKKEVIDKIPTLIKAEEKVKKKEGGEKD